MTERLLKTPDIAERSQVSPTTAKRWRQAGYGPPWIRLRGERGEIRYPESEYEKWVAENLNSSLADEYSKRPEKAPEEWNEPAEPEMVEVYDSRVGRRVLRRKKS
jgi:predicted DNA-binding transcriptional regulator AlpA